MRSIPLVLLAALAAALSAGVSEAAPSNDRPETVRAAPLGAIVDAPDGRSEMELVRFDTRVVSALRELSTGETVRVDDWPVTPGVRRPVVLSRFEVYAPDARIVRFVDGREVELPRSPLAFFRGATADGAAPVSVVTWVDPVAGVRGGFAFDDDGLVEIEPDPDPKQAGALRVLRSDAKFAAGGEPRPMWTCGQDQGEAALVDGPRHSGEEPADDPSSTLPSGLRALAPPTKTAVIAFDTDAEWVNAARHGGSVANAISYIATLVAGVNTIYERDAGSVVNQGVRVLQGYTIIRATEGEDPYVDTTGNADSVKLDEFTNYWEANYPRTVVTRALAAYLSGRQSSSNSASGIAWISGLCNGVGYSVNQLFKVAYQEGDLLILAHEIGHNFGARHTHNCVYGTPPIDTCLAAEGGCSPKGNCPSPQTINGVTNVTGTLMSYCHLRPEMDCNSHLVFHPSSVAGVPAGNPNGILDNIAAGSCLATVAGGVVPSPPSGIGISPGSGPLGGGQAVTITGSGFTSGATVAFVELPSNNVFGGSPNTKVLTGVSVVNSTTITATTPSATNAGLVDVVVMNADQQTATLPSGYTYSSCVGFYLSGVSPATGPTAGNTLVTLTGCGFLSGATVTVRGAAATSVTFVNGSTLTARTPARTVGPADVVVTNPGGATATVPGGFIYTATGSAARLNTITPCRLVDTRNPAGAFGGPALAASSTRSFTVSSGSCGIPADAAGISLNATVADATVAGSLRIFPGSGTPPSTNTITFVPSKNRANNVTVGLVGGVLSVRNDQDSGTVHLILDVNGYYR